MAFGPTRAINAGQSTVLGAYSASQGSGRLLVLQRYRGTGWQRLLTRRANTRGTVFFHVAPGQTSDFRVAVPGVTTRSGVARINVRPGIRLHRGKAVIVEAAKYRGAPYRFGAAGPRAFDCSGFTQYVFRKFGRSLPHSATAQARLGKPVAKSAAQPGDLVFFGRGGRYHHTAIYAGRGYMWDAATYGKPVALRKIWTQRYVVRRVI